MANTPHPTPPPAARAPAPSPPVKPPAPLGSKPSENKAEHKAHEGKAPDDRDREAQPFDDLNVKTVQEEQLERSQEIEQMGLKKWVEAHSSTPEEEDKPAPKAVPGVSPTER